MEGEGERAESRYFFWISLLFPFRCQIRGRDRVRVFKNSSQQSSRDDSHAPVSYHKAKRVSFSMRAAPITTSNCSTGEPGVLSHLHDEDEAGGEELAGRRSLCCNHQRQAPDEGQMRAALALQCPSAGPWWDTSIPAFCCAVDVDAHSRASCLDSSCNQWEN